MLLLILACTHNRPDKTTTYLMGIPLLSIFRRRCEQQPTNARRCAASNPTIGLLGAPVSTVAALKNLGADSNRLKNRAEHRRSSCIVVIENLAFANWPERSRIGVSERLSELTSPLLRGAPVDRFVVPV